MIKVLVDDVGRSAKFTECIELSPFCNTFMSDCYLTVSTLILNNNKLHNILKCEFAVIFSNLKGIIFYRLIFG